VAAFHPLTRGYGPSCSVTFCRRPRQCRWLSARGTGGTRSGEQSQAVCGRLVPTIIPAIWLLEFPDRDDCAFPDRLLAVPLTRAPVAVMSQ